MKHFSSSSLVKQSAMQLCYLRTNEVKPIVSTNQIKGSISASSKSKSVYIEMRGTYSFENVLLHYCFDEIRPGYTFIEHKSVIGKIANWYLENSILQVALYAAIAKVNPNTMLYTASFHNGPKHCIDIKSKLGSFVLLMGNKQYTVVVTNPDMIVGHYVDKAIASLSYDKAKPFDAKYKRMEYGLLKPFFKVL